jgi:peptidoglycan/xylan/chitin deacetylase (PgdA/CDA1 family)/glycosyltransferase involved in cell wall biosynthesis
MPRPVASMPAVTIVVSAGDSLGDLQCCLDALAGQVDRNSECEIIVVFDESKGEIDPARLSPSAHLRLMHVRGRTLGDAWNRGAEAANGKVLLFMGDNCRARPDLLAAHRAIHAQREDVLVLGMVQPPPRVPGQDVPLVDHWRESLRDFTADGSLSFLEASGQTLSMRSETLRRVGPFCTGLRWGAEVEMAFRVVKHGGLLVRLPEPVGLGHMPAPDQEIEASAREAGASSVELYRRIPDLLPHLELGAFKRGTPAGLRLRRLLLAMGGPGLPYGLIRSLLPRGRPRERWNRFLLSYQYWRGVREAVRDPAIWSSLTRAPIILMYHAVAAPGEPAGCYIVPLSRFKRQMAWLKFAGYRVLRFEDLLDYKREHRLPPGRSVVLTFDDGYADNRHLAFPILSAHGFSAIFFLVTGAVGGKNVWDTSGELAGRSLLSWTDIRELLKAGMEIGAHTRHHVALPRVSHEEAVQEIAGSRADLERELGQRIRAFAYPYGLLDAATSDAVARAGFDGACCSRSGSNDPVISSYLLRRLEVRGTDSILQLIRALGRGHAARRRDRR